MDFILEAPANTNPKKEESENKRPSTLVVPIEELKYIIRGDDMILTDNIKLHNPTINEIIDFGEQKYFQLVSLITMRPYDDMVGLDDAGLNYQDFTDYDIFLRNRQSLNAENSSIILGDLDLSKLTVVKDEETQELVLVNDNNEIIINEIIYSYMVTFIRKTNFISSKLEYDVGNETTRRYLIKKKRKEMKKREKKLAKKQNDFYDSYLLNITSFLCSVSGCKYNYDTILNLHISQLYDNYYRYTVIDERNHYLNILSTGMVKSDKRDDKKLNCLRRLIED